MKALLAIALSLISFALTMTIRVKDSNAYTTHVGMRVPPMEAKCMKTGQFQTDEGKLLKVFQCPTRAA